MKKLLCTISMLCFMVIVFGGAVYAASSYNSTLRMSLGTSSFLGSYRTYTGGDNMKIKLSMTTVYDRIDSNADCKIKATLIKKKNWYSTTTISSKYYYEGYESKTWTSSSIVSGKQYAFKFAKTADADLISVTSDDVVMSSN